MSDPVNVTKLDVEAMKKLKAAGGRLAYHDLNPNTAARLRKLGYVVITTTSPKEHVLLDDGHRYLAGLDGSGPKHWHLVVNGEPACESALVRKMVVEAAGCASHKKGEVEEWARRVARNYPELLRKGELTVEVVPGDCDPVRGRGGKG